MLIDWFTVGAQAINFLILVWLLKRYLYKPILDAIDARETKIAAELADAEAKKAEAQQERNEFQHKNEEFDQQRAALMSKVADEAKAERQRLLDEARQGADALRARRQQALTQEQNALNVEITRRTSEEVFAIARKTLTDLATTSLEERICDVFTRRLRELSSEAKEDIASALKGLSDPALVRTAFELPSQQRDAIQQAINETFLADIPVRYEVAPEIIGGIELSANGRKVAWSIDDYLVSLQTSIGELLQVQSKTPANVEGKGQSGTTVSAAAEAK